MPIHSIKLKGPWTVQWHPDGVANPAPVEPQTIHLPADCRTLFGNVPGVACFERRFNQPTGLTALHQVRIRFRDAAELLEARINDAPRPLQRATDGSQFIDVADCLKPHNRLSVDILCDPAISSDSPTGLWQPVVLEIEESK